MADDFVVRVLGEQRKRLVATLMRRAETSDWWRSLSQDERAGYRDHILSSVGVFYDLCRDIIKVGHEDSVRNELSLSLIQQVHDSQRRVEKLLSEEE